MSDENRCRSARLEAFEKSREIFEKYGITADIVDDPYERQMQRLNGVIEEVRKSALKDDDTSFRHYFGLRAFQTRLMLVYMDETDWVKNMEAHIRMLSEKEADKYKGY